MIVASFVMLFAELTLIRWVAAYQVHVAYFTNFVLLASFLGIGVGFLRARSTRDLSRLAPAALAVLGALVFVVRVVKGSGGPQGVETIFGIPAPPIWVMLPLIFGGTTFVMAVIAEAVARLFARFEPLEAYRLDILGSLAGIVAFSLLSFVRLGPALWGVVLGAGFVVLAPRVDRRRWLAAGGVVVAFAAGSLAPRETWSPYYRVSILGEQASGRIPLLVNSLPHQSVLPLDVIRREFYALPYTHLAGRSPGRVLIVGAGNGNDVALALAEGATSVDAVEIDPVLQGLGRELHPARPYQDARVTAHIQDGRAFLERTAERYDLILFALPDSLTLVSGQGSLRLESFLFTREAMTSVREHLAPSGVFAMYNYYRPFVFTRYAGTMAEVFGHVPCFDPGEQTEGLRRQAVLTIGLEAHGIRCSTPWALPAIAPEPATDDHPFPYVRARAIPRFYLIALAGILGASILVVRRASGAPLEQMRPYVDLFLMGAAFLLLETKNVVQFALLFGTTWFVNALVFAGILLSVLGAIEVARRWRPRRPWLLPAILLTSVAVAWSVPVGALLGLAPVPRFVAGVALAFAPVFAANLLFADRFRDVGASTVAFGANLLGAMVGGVLEYGAIAVGYRNLLVGVAALYLGAIVTGRKAVTARSASAL